MTALRQLSLEAFLERAASSSPTPGGGTLAAVRSAGRAPGGRILLEVSATNDAALAFYASAGFVEIDRRRRYYRDGTDALVLQAPVPDPAGGATA